MEPASEVSPPDGENEPDERETPGPDGGPDGTAGEVDTSLGCIEACTEQGELFCTPSQVLRGCDWNGTCFRLAAPPACGFDVECDANCADELCPPLNACIDAGLCLELGALASDTCTECGAGGAIVTRHCDDGNPCTVDSCAAGECDHDPASALCNDGDPCTTEDACVAGECIGGSPVGCSGIGSCALALLCTPSASTLLAHWKLDGDFDDSVAGAELEAYRSGGFSPMAVTVAGENSCYGPTGATDSNGAEGVVPVDASTEALTLELWVRLGSVDAAGTIAGFWFAGADAPSLALTIEDGILQLRLGAGADAVVAGIAQPDTACWTHVAVRLPLETGAVPHLFVNGTPTAPLFVERAGFTADLSALSMPAPMTLLGDRFKLGAVSGPGAAVLTLDDVKLWAGLRSLQEIAEGSEPNQADALCAVVNPCAAGGCACEPCGPCATCDGFSGTCKPAHEAQPCEDDGESCTTGTCDEGTCAESPQSGEPCEDGDECTGDGVCMAGVCAGDALGCAGVFGCSVPPECPPSNAVLLGHWPLDGNFNDAAGTHHLTPVPQPPGLPKRTSDGFVPNDAVLPGANEGYGPTGYRTGNGATSETFVQPDSPQGVTLEAWINSGSENYLGTLVGWGDGRFGSDNLQLSMDSGFPRIYVGGKAGRTVAEFERPTEGPGGFCWYHIAVRIPLVSGEAVAGFVNGVAVKAKSGTGTMPDDVNLTGPFSAFELATLAPQNNQPVFGIAVDEVKVWRGLRSALEIAESAKGNNVAQCQLPDECAAGDKRPCITPTQKCAECSAGVCVTTGLDAPSPSKCLINDVCWDPFERNPENACQHCNPAISTSGWTQVADNYSCTDECNAAATCLSGTCVVTEAKDCSDPNPCTADSCVVGIGCQHVPQSGTSCDYDGLACTADTCVAGSCSEASIDPGWCVIDNTCYHFTDPVPGSNSDCLQCDPIADKLKWTPHNNGGSCGPTFAGAESWTGKCAEGVCWTWRADLEGAEPSEVPLKCASELEMRLWGAGGGNGGPRFGVAAVAPNGGAGGYARAQISVTTTDVLSVWVGSPGKSGTSPSSEGGLPGGGSGGDPGTNCAGGGGGGYTAVSRGETLVAIAGGGGGGSSGAAKAPVGGAGGGVEGATGAQPASGSGGQALSGGQGGVGGQGYGPGEPGASLSGGAALSVSDPDGCGGGGGGGGYFGGGAGATWLGTTAGSFDGGGGGGGSGWVMCVEEPFCATQTGSGTSPPASNGASIRTILGTKRAEPGNRGLAAFTCID